MKSGNNPKFFIASFFHPFGSAKEPQPWGQISKNQRAKELKEKQSAQAEHIPTKNSNL
jgi:hypothetical protein